MPTTNSRRSLSPHKLTSVFLLTTVICLGLRAIPNATTPTAKASVCSVPVVGIVCDAFSGSFGGVKFLVDKATGAIKNIASRKVIGWVTKAGCVAGAGAATDGIGAGVMAGICAKASDWLLNKLAGTGKSSSTATSPSSPSTTTTPPPTNGNGNGNGGNNNGGGGNNTPQDGTPASALSTVPMAALAAVATIFVATHISSDTQANLTSGWFQPLYAGVENYAWLLAVIAVAAGGIYIMITARGGELAMLLGRIPFAAILMVGVPVAAMVAMQIVDLMSSDLMKVFPDGTHMLHVVAGVLGVLGGASILANLLGHSTIAHFTGTGAWLIGMFGLLASGAIALELIAREIAIYLTVLIVPLALVGEIFSPFARWAMALIKVLFVIIITKVFLALGLVVAGTLMITGLTHLSPILVIVGLVALILIALFPALIYGALIRIESAWHSGVGHMAIGGTHMATGGARSTTMAQHLRHTHTRVQTAMRPSAPPPPSSPPPPSPNGNGPSSGGNQQRSNQPPPTPVP